VRRRAVLAIALAALFGALAWRILQPRRQPAPAPAPAAGGGAAAARLAVVIDDVGPRLAPLRPLFELGLPLSIAVLPHQLHTRRAAEMARRRGLEVLVHLPMEPLAYPQEDPGPGALLSSMDAGEIRETLRQALAAVPHAAGLSNHMGSRLTRDRRALDLVMVELRQRGLYFLDSRTTPLSAAEEAARRAGVRFAARDVFLDEVAERRAVAAQLRRAVGEARRAGAAVAIGHPLPATVEVLRRELPGLALQGVRLVFASELAS
jgi:hypothetical protein